MIRDTLATNAMHYSIFRTQDGNRLANQWRSCTNCNSGHSDGPRTYDRSISLKLTKTGNVFEAFIKKIGSDEWTKFGATREMEFTNEYYYVGIAVCSHDNSKVATLDGRDFHIGGDMYYFPSAAPSDRLPLGAPCTRGSDCTSDYCAGHDQTVCMEDPSLAETREEEPCHDEV